MSEKEILAPEIEIEYVYGKWRIILCAYPRILWRQLFSNAIAKWHSGTLNSGSGMIVLGLWISICKMMCFLIMKNITFIAVLSAFLSFYGFSTYFVPTNFAWYSVAMKILFIINIIRASIVAENHKMVKTAAYFDILLLLTESAAFYEIQAWILIISPSMQWRNFNAFTKIWQTFNFPEYRILIYTRNQKMQYLRWSRTVEYKPENDHVSQWKLQSSQ